MSLAVFVCEHAVERYCQRVEDVAPDDARQALSGPAFQAAARFGAQVVRLPGRFRAVLSHSRVRATVLTVLSDDRFPAQLLPPAEGGIPFVRDTDWRERARCPASSLPTSTREG